MPVRRVAVTVVGGGVRDERSGGAVPDVVYRWERAVHDPGIYDLEVDTSTGTPEECAEADPAPPGGGSADGVRRAGGDGREKVTNEAQARARAERSGGQSDGRTVAHEPMEADR